MKPYALAIIACSASKLDKAAPARDLYTGALFKASLAVAEDMADRVVILSAKHGVLELDAVVEPYDVSLASMDKTQKLIWGDMVARALLKVLGIKDRTNIKECEAVGSRVLCLAPGSYVKCIGHLYGKGKWSMPLEGLGIGHQKQRLAAMLQQKEAA